MIFGGIYLSDYFYVVDSAVFIMGGVNIPFSKMVTVSSVYDEMKSLESRLRFDVALSEGLKVESVSDKFRNDVIEAASKTKDINELSKTDIDVLAKALEYKNMESLDENKKSCVLITDDFSVQNVASFLQIDIKPVAQSVINDQIIWQKQCIGCFRHFKEGEDCPVCGSKLRKKMKKKKKSFAKRNNNFEKSKGFKDSEDSDDSEDPQNENFNENFNTKSNINSNTKSNQKTNVKSVDSLFKK